MHVLKCNILHSLFLPNFSGWGAQWPSGRALDSRARGWGLFTYLRRVVSLRKDTFTPQKVLGIPRKRWLRPDMTEKLFTGMLSLNKTKTNLPNGPHEDILLIIHYVPAHLEMICCKLVLIKLFIVTFIYI